jgi:hypothetical protein
MNGYVGGYSIRYDSICTILIAQNWLFIIVIMYIMMLFEQARRKFSWSMLGLSAVGSFIQSLHISSSLEPSTAFKHSTQGNQKCPSASLPTKKTWVKWA